MAATTLLSDNGVTSGITGYTLTGGNDGTLQLQTTTAGGTATTAVTIDDSQNTTLAGALAVNGSVTLGDASTDTILMTGAPSIGGAGLGMGMGFRNRIINGDMRIDQRNAGATVTGAADGTWVVDRWICYHNIATVNVGQNLNSVASVNGIPNQMGIQITTPATATSTQYTNFQHYIEGFNAADLAWGTSDAKAITISFWVRSSVTGTQGFALQNASSALGYPFTVTINAANTWEYKTVAIAGPTTGTWNTTNGRGITLIVDLGQGSSYRFAAGSWQAGNVQGVTGANSLNQTSGATFYITGVQLEKGSTATSFDYRPYGTEFMLCQRYYQQTGAYFAITEPGVETRTTGSPPLKVNMRASPTVSLPTGMAFHRPAIAFYSCTSVIAGGSADGSGYVTVDISAGAGTLTSGQMNAGLIYSAEL